LALMGERRDCVHLCEWGAEKLAEELAHRSLVLTNWIRTIAWSAKGLLLLAMTAHMLTAAASATAVAKG